MERHTKNNASGRIDTHTGRWFPWSLIILAAGGLVVALLNMPAIPELISEEEYRVKNRIFTFDENQNKETEPESLIKKKHSRVQKTNAGQGMRHKGEEGQMGKRDSAKTLSFSSENHYGIKGAQQNSAPLPLRVARKGAIGSGSTDYSGLGMSGTGYGGGGTGQGSISIGSLSGIGHGAGGGSGTGYGRGVTGGTISPLAGIPEFNTENYQHIEENIFLEVVESPLSTFSIDVDTASYANVRRYLNKNLLPPPDAVRVEELINYFTYKYPDAEADKPFSTVIETGPCPWNKNNLLTRIGLRAKDFPVEHRPTANLVFLIDVSGSMWSEDKLPLLKQSMKMLINQLRPKDRVSIVVYAGAVGMVLPSTAASDKQKILDAVYHLEAGGSTNGGAGITLAYQQAARHFIKNGINRVILATDGDFNVGVTSHGDLTRLIEEKRKSGVYLSVLGFGTGNYKDAALEQLADKGNGNYAYIDSLGEAQKVLVQQMGQTLVTVAKDVKIQVEFNPAQVRSYRLIGYENRKLAARDFNDDTKDAGEIGAGHTVTAMYELVPAKTITLNSKSKSTEAVSLRYQSDRTITAEAQSNELYTLKLRYKQPNDSTSKLMEFRVMNNVHDIQNVSDDFTFAASVAGFGMLLRGSKWVTDSTFEQFKKLAVSGAQTNKDKYRNEFVKLIDKAKQLTSSTAMLSHQK